MDNVILTPEIKLMLHMFDQILFLNGAETLKIKPILALKYQKLRTTI